MLEIKYSIYQCNEDYSSMTEGVVCDNIYDVASELVDVDNNRISDLIYFMLQNCSDEQEIFIHKSIAKYICQIAENIKEYYDYYRNEMIPIDEIPDFKYLDNYYVHKFVIEIDE